MTAPKPHQSLSGRLKDKRAALACQCGCATAQPPTHQTGLRRAQHAVKRNSFKLAGEGATPLGDSKRMLNTE